MQGYVDNIQSVTLSNTSYRKVLYTSHYTQLVVMCLKPKEEIGEEIHGLDQFLRIEQGQGQVILNQGQTVREVKDDYAVIIPAGTYHNVINTGDTDLKLYTLYSPPAHLKDTHQPTKADEVEDHFDGHTTETHQ